MRKSNVFFLLVFCTVLFSCSKKEGSLFKNIKAQEAGITFKNTLIESDDLNILDYLYFYNGGGVAIGDINDDGLPDLFFSGNQVKNELYLNKGNLSFENITAQAGVAGNSTWNTGAVMGDVNGDGLLDIYVCAVVGINGFNGHNELYINNGDMSFTESAQAYGLDIDSYSSNAAFLDYDKDGDLDLYILNHAVHTQNSFGNVALRYERNYQTGDKLMRNDGGTFVEVSEEAGIYGGINSYGLGISVADFNQDGWPDIYVGNDFHEDDYYYINNQDGTFSEKLTEYFGHTSRFSMGSDATDINHDGWPDLISLDMLPEDEKVIKSSEGDDNIQIQKLRTGKFGYHYQFTRNMLYVNQQGYDFQETALLSGIAATDWSWSALFADFNQDAEQDLFISNGIPKRPNNLDYIKFVSSDQIQNKIDKTKLVDQRALDLMPSGNTSNYIFKGKEGIRFDDMSGAWTQKDTLVSGATAYGDLDNDGDLDLVSSTINGAPAIYINKTNQSAQYLKVYFEYTDQNRFGIGTKVHSYHQGVLQSKELYTIRGFQASSEPMVHFGYGTATMVDSLKIIWPNNTTQTLYNIATNQRLTVAPTNPLPFSYDQRPQYDSLFKKVPTNLGIDFIHLEDSYIDFNRQKLMPYQIGDRGPAVAIGDLNKDGLEDVFFGGSKFIPSQVYLQQPSAGQSDSLIGFSKALQNPLPHPRIVEDVVAVIDDFDGDGSNDLIIGSGGGDFKPTAEPLLDYYYQHKDSTFSAQSFPPLYENTSVIAKADYDGDGDQDVFVGSQSVTGDFGQPTSSYLLLNDKGVFSQLETDVFENIGIINDAIWTDFNDDGSLDLIIVGEWMSPRFIENTKGTFKEVNMLDQSLDGLWQQIHPFDIDADGDMDYLLGNWGENSKFVASREAPLLMYYDDFDEDGQTETIVATKKGSTYYPLEGLDELAGQMTSLRKKYDSYEAFAGESVEDILGRIALSTSAVYSVEILSSGYLKNENGTFEFVPFPDRFQVAPILSFVTFDFDDDGQEEVLAAGNYFGMKPFHGRLDSFSGALIKDANTLILAHKLGLDLAQKSVRDLSIITYLEKPYLLVTYNNEKVEVYDFIKKNKNEN